MKFSATISSATEPELVEELMDSFGKVSVFQYSSVRGRRKRERKKKKKKKKKRKKNKKLVKGKSKHTTIVGFPPLNLLQLSGIDNVRVVDRPDILLELILGQTVAVLGHLGHEAL